MTLLNTPLLNTGINQESVFTPSIEAGNVHSIMQRTLASVATCEGTGLHSGQLMRMTLKPAEANSGIVFIRTDKESENEIKAHHDNVCNVLLSSNISNGQVAVGTIEHLMAAFALSHIDNAIVELDGGEVPIMDGSARIFLDKITQGGVATLNAPRQFLRILKAVQVQGEGGSVCTLQPETDTIFEAEIDFTSRAIGKQSYATRLNGSVDEKVAHARTFCMLAEVEAMQKAQRALGGSLDNAIIVDGDTILNEEGLRDTREFVQHKLLDAMGDMALMGMPFIGRYKGYKSGHALHHKLLTALFADPSAYEITQSEQKTALAAE